jgi:hypothetical protein
MVASGAAHAANDTTDNVDVMNEVSQKGLMRIGQIKMVGIEKEEVYGALPFERFDQVGSDANSEEAVAWCIKSATNMQLARGNVDAKTGEARLTEDAIQAACGKSFGVTGTIKVECSVRKKFTFRTFISIILNLIDKQKYQITDTFVVCDAEGELKFNRYTVALQNDKPVFTMDKTFGKAGVEKIDSSYDANWALVGAVTEAEILAKKAAARLESTTWVKQSLRRQMLGIKDFQIHAPITALAGGSVATCVPKAIAYPDQPVYVVYATDKGEKEVGFAKFRDLADGCTMTEELEVREKAKPKSVKIGPSKAQLIIGQGTVKAGMTVWEMPSLGLNMGLGVGFLTPLSALGTIGGVNPSLELEYNLSRFIPLSEFYVTGSVLAGVSPSAGLSSIGATAGLMKRFYLGRPFIDLGAKGAVISSSSTASLGGGGSLGLGVQLSPRFFLRLGGDFMTDGTNHQVGAGLSVLGTL